MTNTRTARAPRRIGVNVDAAPEERKMMILEAAARLFAEKGVHRTSVDDVASHLGVTKPTIYHYIASKDEMVSQVIDFALTRIRKAGADADRVCKSGLDKLRFIIRQGGQYATDGFSRCLATVDFNDLADKHKEENRRLHRELSQYLVHAIEEGVEDGSIRPSIDSHVYAFTILGAILSLSRWYREGGPLSIAAVTEQMIEVLEVGGRRSIDS